MTDWRPLFALYIPPLQPRISVPLLRYAHRQVVSGGTSLHLRLVALVPGHATGREFASLSAHSPYKICVQTNMHVASFDADPLRGF
jgi:hypothetical protein